MTSTVESGPITSGQHQFAKHHVASREVAFTRGTDSYLRVAAFHPTMAGGTAGSNPGEAYLSPNVLDIKNHIEFAQTAEEIGLDYLFMAEGFGPATDFSKEASLMNPWLFCPTLAATLFPWTKRIGIVTTMHFAFLSPIVIARMGANLDALSGGRWGFNMVTGPSGAPGLVPEPERSLSHNDRYGYAHEAMECILALWRGEDVDHSGQFLELKGRMVDPLPVQDPPGLISAGHSPVGLDFAATYADYLFTMGGSKEQHELEHEGLEDALERHGRKLSDLRKQVRGTTYIRDTQAEVDEFRERLASLFVPRPAVTDGATAVDFGLEHNEKLTKIETETQQIKDAKQSAIGMDYTLQGTPDSVARRIIDAYRDGMIQGCALLFQDWHPSELRQFSKVLALLREEGIWVHPKERGYSW